MHQRALIAHCRPNRYPFLCPVSEVLIPESGVHPCLKVTSFPRHTVP